MLDVVDTPYRGGVLCLRGGALCSASVWRIHHIKHNTPPLYGVSTTVMRICSLSCIALMKCLVRGVRMFEEMLSETGFYKRYTPFESSFAVD